MCHRLTYDLKQVGKQDDILGGPRPVGPVAEQWAGQQAAEAECRQDQTQKVGRRIQSLQVLPHRRQDHSWRSRGRAVLALGAAVHSIHNQLTASTTVGIDPSKLAFKHLGAAEPSLQ